MDKTCWAWFLICIFHFGTAPSEAQSTPVGDEFQVNITTTDYQRNPHVAADGSAN